jgi:hypothetical protein
MEQQLGNYGAYNPDAVVLPARSKRKKRRRKAGGQGGGGGGQSKKESKMKKEKVEVKNRKHSNNNNNDDEEEELAIVEQLSEMSSGGEEDYNTTGGNQQQKASAGKNIGSRHSGIIQRQANKAKEESEYFVHFAGNHTRICLTPFLLKLIAILVILSRFVLLVARPSFRMVTSEKVYHKFSN